MPKRLKKFKKLKSKNNRTFLSFILDQPKLYYLVNLCLIEKFILPSKAFYFFYTFCVILIFSEISRFYEYYLLITSFWNLYKYEIYYTSFFKLHTYLKIKVIEPRCIKLKLIYYIPLMIKPCRLNYIYFKRFTGFAKVRYSNLKLHFSKNIILNFNMNLTILYKKTFLKEEKLNLKKFFKNNLNKFSYDNKLFLDKLKILVKFLGLFISNIFIINKTRLNFYKFLDDNFCRLFFLSTRENFKRNSQRKPRLKEFRSDFALKRLKKLNYFTNILFSFYIFRTIFRHSYYTFGAVLFLFLFLDLIDFYIFLRIEQ